ncbi:MAG: hypothetical protein V4629_02355 [Pseudomonadota bacterium]
MPNQYCRGSHLSSWQFEHFVRIYIEEVCMCLTNNNKRKYYLNKLESLGVKMVRQTFAKYHNDIGDWLWENYIFHPIVEKVDNKEIINELCQLIFGHVKYSNMKFRKEIEFYTGGNFFIHNSYEYHVLDRRSDRAYGLKLENFYREFSRARWIGAFIREEGLKHLSDFENLSQLSKVLNKAVDTLLMNLIKNPLLIKNGKT